MIRHGIYLFLLLTSASASAAQEPPLTRELAVQAVANSCPYDKYLPSDAAWIATNRNRFVVNDRLTTRNNETWINRLIVDQEKCLLATRRQIDQSTTISDADRLMLRSAISERQRQTPDGVRAMFAAAGYRPSSAPPGPRYGYCIIHDDFGQQFNDIDHYYISRVFIDRDPENEVAATGGQADPNKADPQSAEGQKVLNAMSQWAAERYRRASRREAFCRFFLSAQEAADVRPKDETTRDPFNFQLPLP